MVVPPPPPLGCSLSPFGRCCFGWCCPPSPYFGWCFLVCPFFWLCCLPPPWKLRLICFLFMFCQNFFQNYYHHRKRGGGKAASPKKGEKKATTIREGRAAPLLRRTGRGTVPQGERGERGSSQRRRQVPPLDSKFTPYWFASLCACLYLSVSVCVFVSISTPQPQPQIQALQYPTRPCANAFAPSSNGSWKILPTPGGKFFRTLFAV